MIAGSGRPLGHCHAPGPATGLPLRVGVAGDSHIAALKFALDQGLFRSESLTFTFWGALGDNLDAMQADRERIYWCKDIGRRRVFSNPYSADLPYRNFDVFFFYGGQIRLDTLYSEYASLTGSMRKRYSRNFIEDGITSLLRDAPILQVAKVVARHSGKRVIWAPRPLKAGHRRLFKKISNSKQQRVNQLLAGALADDDISILYQAPQTIRANYYTRRRYAIGSGRSLRDRLRVEADRSHMNASYGAILLERLSARILGAD